MNPNNPSPQAETSQNPEPSQSLPPTIPPVSMNAQASTQPTQSKPASPVVGAPPPKRSFPKIIIILPILLLLGLAIFFVVKNLLPNLGKGQAAGALTWWGLWEDESVVAPLISEYESNHPGVKIKYIKESQQDYRERLTNSLAKGEGPDIFRFHNTWVPMFKNNLDYLPTKVMSSADFAKTFYPVMLSDLSYGNGIVGIPLGYDGLTLFINDEIFSKAGKTPPTTWDDLRKTACELTTTVNDSISQSGVALGRTENVDQWQDILALMMLQNRANPAKPTDQLAKDALAYFTMFSTDAACKDYGVSKVWDETLPPSTIAFSSGKLAMYFGQSWRIFEIKNQNPNLRFRTVPVPQLPKTGQGEADISYASYWVEGVWVKSKNKDAAWDFLKFLSTKESLTKLYQNAAKIDPNIRPFGEPYPRVDMADLISSDPLVGSIVSQASYAQSWYLVSRTWDGPTGINSQINKYYEDAINAVNGGDTADEALDTVANGVSQVLSQYGLVAR